MPSDFYEQTIEDIIFENQTTIHTKGLSRLKGKTFRQVILPSGKKIDLFSFEIIAGCLQCDIYELKREIINADAICQGYGYFKEIKCLTKNYFQSLEARIIMVGKRYEPVSILDALPVAYRVFTYEYKIDGIKFREVENPYVCYPSPNENFSYGLWAFGYGGLNFTNTPRTVNFQSAFESYTVNKIEFKTTIKDLIDCWVKDPQILEAPEELLLISEPILQKSKVYTEIFPEPLSWTKEFAASIPLCKSLSEEFDDLQDDCDYEDDQEGDMSDYEEEPLEKCLYTEWINPNDTNYEEGQPIY